MMYEDKFDVRGRNNPQLIEGEVIHEWKDTCGNYLRKMSTDKVYFRYASYVDFSPYGWKETRSVK